MTDPRMLDLAQKLPKGDRRTVSSSDRSRLLSDLALAFHYQKGIKEADLKNLVKTQMRFTREFIATFSKNAGKPEFELINALNIHYVTVIDSLRAIKELLAPKKELRIELRRVNMHRLFVVLSIQEVNVEAINFLVDRFRDGKPVNNTVSLLLERSVSLSSWVGVEEELVTRWLQTTVR